MASGEENTPEMSSEFVANKSLSYFCDKSSALCLPKTAHRLTKENS